jgi:hypothetical protein
MSRSNGRSGIAAIAEQAAFELRHSERLEQREPEDLFDAQIEEQPPR